MAFGTSTMRGFSRYASKIGHALPRLALYAQDLTPDVAPLYIRPTEVPNGTQAEGDIWFDDDDHKIAFYDGTKSVEVATNYRTVKTAAATLAATDSGALCIFNAAAGFTYTLPDAVAGLWFEFVVQTTVTSVVARVACASGDFLLGTILQGTDGTFTQTAVTANGSTHLAWEGNGSTTGGIIGDHFWVTAISGTQWEIYGTNTATGSEATPFKTS